MKPALPLCAILLWGWPLGVTAQMMDCDAALSQADMTHCAVQDFQSADADLNAAYKTARDGMRRIDAGLPASERGAEMALRDAQRAWISFRDQACKAEGYLMHGGSAEPMVVYGCMARLTQQRATDLAALGEPS